MAVYSSTAPFTRNKIVLKSLGSVYDEKTAAGTIYPGFLLINDSNDKVIAHNLVDGKAELCFALEDSMQGHWFLDAYSSGDIVPVRYLHGGDLVLAAVQASQAAIAKGDYVSSNGDGTLRKAAVKGTKLYSNVAASSSVTNTSTATAFDLSYTIPANYLAVGDVIRIKAQAIAPTTNSTDTLTLTLKMGSTTIIATAAVDVANGDIGYIEADLVIRTIGASGTYVGAGVQGLGVPGTVTAKPWLLGSTAIDTTATQALTVVAAWSVASTSDITRLDVLEIEILRAAGSYPLGVALEALDNSAISTLGHLGVRLL